MKRCPECDFIYEDDDRLCAMDGNELVNHSGPSPFEIVLPQSGNPANSHGKSLTLVAAGIILISAVSFYFHNIAKRTAVQSSLHNAAETYKNSPPADQQPNFAVPTPPASRIVSEPLSLSPKLAKPKAPKTDTDQQFDRDPFRAVSIASPTPASRRLPSFSPARATSSITSYSSISPAAKPTVAPSPSQTPLKAQNGARLSDANQKSDSRITSFLKKTGRVLKKPFKN